MTIAVYSDDSQRKTFTRETEMVQTFHFFFLIVYFMIHYFLALI